MDKLVIIAKDKEDIFILAYGTKDEVAEKIDTYKRIAKESMMDTITVSMSDTDVEKYMDNWKLLKNDFISRFSTK